MVNIPRLTSETFVCEHRGRHLIHIPLLDTTLLANRSMADLFRRLQTDPRAPLDPEQSAALCELERLGLVNGPAPTPPLSRLQQVPTEVALFLTEHCNLRCTYCYARGGEGRRTMSFPVARAALRRIVANAVAIGARGITVHFHGGGEVTMVWDLLKRIAAEARRLAGSEGMAVRFTAGLNGVMSRRRALESVQLLDDATVSMDGIPRVHDRNRPTREGRPTSWIIERNLRLFDAENFSYGIRVTVLPDDVHVLPQGIDYLCRKSAAALIQAEPVYPLGRYEDGREPDPWAFIHAFRAARKVAEGYGRTLKYSGARFPQVTDVFCQAVTGAFAVMPGGGVSSCFEAREEDSAFIYGAYDPVQDDFRIDQRRHRSQLDFAVHHRVSCRECIAKYHCAGDCAMKAQPGRQDTTRCVINRELTKDLILESMEERLE